MPGRRHPALLATRGFLACVVSRRVAELLRSGSLPLSACASSVARAAAAEAIEVWASDAEGQVGRMEVLASRVLLRPTDVARSVAYYRDGLGLAVVREFGVGGQVTGTVFALGGGFLEVSGTAPGPAGPSVQLWLQVRSARATYDEVTARGVQVLRPPLQEPWGLVEMWLADPDGVRIAVVEVPEDHPLRRRVE